MEPIIVSIIITAVATGIAAFSYVDSKKIIQKKMRKAPFKRIALVENGETVTIAGNVVFHKRFITAPLSDRECVYYHATVERKKSSGKSTKWVNEIDEAAAVNFLLDDGDRVAVVDANAVEGYIEMDEHYKSGAFNPATPKMESFLNKYQYTSKGIMGFNKNMRYKEGALEKHEYCIVCGTCYWEKAADHDIEGYEEVLVIKSTKGNPVYISDKEDILI